MNLPLCRKENRKNEPKTAQSGGFLCKMTKKSQKFRHFDRAPTFVSAGISAFWHFSTKNEAKFVQNYLLTNSRNYVIIIIESEGTIMENIKIKFYKRGMTVWHDWKRTWEEVTYDDVPKSYEDFRNMKMGVAFSVRAIILINGYEFTKRFYMQNCIEEGFGEEQLKKDFENFWKFCKIMLDKPQTM